MGTAVKKAIAPVRNSESTQRLQSYITSLLYLNQEAKREGLNEVAGILQDSISAINLWLESREAPCSTYDLCDHSLYYSLEFMMKLMTMPNKKKVALVSLLHQFEEESGTLEFSKRTIS